MLWNGRIVNELRLNCTMSVNNISCDMMIVVSIEDLIVIVTGIRIKEFGEKMMDV